jgi:hypothetical protein
MMLDTILWPLSTIERWKPDYGASDIQAEIKALFERQRMVDALMAGEIPLDELLDCLNDQGISPDQYCTEAVANIEEILSGEIATDFDPDEISIYLPC